MKKLIRVLAICLMILCGPAMIIYLNPIVDEKLGTAEVLTAAKEIQRGEVIKQDQVKKVRIKTSLVVKASLMKSSNEIVGQEASRSIHANEQFDQSMLILDRLTPGNGEYNMPLPSEWVLSAPGSLLRGDQVTLTPVLEQRVSVTASDITEESPAADEPAAWSAKNQEQLSNIDVSFAKSSNNQEVTTEDNDRKKPTGQVNRIELIVNQEQRDLIVGLGQKNYKFLVTYR
ncbi:SAF domain-containing protein [Cohnella sp. GCM10020058]|uniref:SAF domain-containing protein n=1 Tax=Cohnella sp. GCM10020058 TaxID=3317330 RepID=UPI003645A7D7